MKKNDCYKCPHREQVPGSAHSQCNAIKNGVGEVKNLKNFVKFHPHGVKMGWCIWPINFDPVWVECHLPIENNENQEHE